MRTSNSDKSKLAKLAALQALIKAKQALGEEVNLVELLQTINRLDKREDNVGDSQYTLEEITKLEEHINKEARIIVTGLGFEHIPFRVFFVAMEDPMWKIKFGTTVNLFTSITPNHPDFYPTLRYWLTKLPRFHSHSDLSRKLVKERNAVYIGQLESSSNGTIKHGRFKRIIRKVYADLTEILPLLPKYRFVIVDSHRLLTVKDKFTGISHTIQAPNDVTDFNDEKLSERAWIELSRKVLKELPDQDYWNLTLVEEKDE